MELSLDSIVLQQSSMGMTKLHNIDKHAEDRWCFLQSGHTSSWEWQGVKTARVFVCPICACNCEDLLLVIVLVSKGMKKEKAQCVKMYIYFLLCLRNNSSGISKWKRIKRRFFRPLWQRYYKNTSRSSTLLWLVIIL